MSFCIIRLRTTAFLLALTAATAFSAPYTQTADQAARYQLKYYRGFQVNRTEVIYAHLGDYRVRLQPQDAIADVWQKTINPKRPVLYRFFLRQKRGIYYEVPDLQGSSSSFTWKNVAYFVPEDWFQLPSKKISENTKTYTGTKDLLHVNFTWFIDKKMPVNIELKASGFHQELHFIEFIPVSDLLKQLNTFLNFDTIDYADIGDQAHDPFLASMIKQGFIEPAGGHCHFYCSNN